MLEKERSTLSELLVAMAPFTAGEVKQALYSPILHAEPVVWRTVPGFVLIALASIITI